MDNPNWAERLSAISALWAAIFAGIAAVATGAAAIFAFLAVRWAKRAADESAKQAKAAIDSVEWSRKAAEASGDQSKAALASVDAAREQVDLMRQEMEWNEPQPILFITIDFSNPPTGPGGSLSVKNVGSAPAFDIQVEPISVTGVPPDFSIVSAVRFFRMPVLKDGQIEPMSLMPPDRFLDPFDAMFQKHTIDMGGFLKTLIDRSADSAALLTGDRTKTYDAGKIAASYCNARGATFRQEFQLAVSGGDRIEIYPEGSLVRGRVKTNDAVTARNIIMRNVGY